MFEHLFNNLSMQEFRSTAFSAFASSHRFGQQGKKLFYTLSNNCKVHFKRPKKSFAINWKQHCHDRTECLIFLSIEKQINLAFGKSGHFPDVAFQTRDFLKTW